MLENNDQRFLFDALEANKCVLFVGAGFSRDARNRLGMPLPDGKLLASGLWRWLGYPGDYDGTSLDLVYQAALDAGRKLTELQQFLEERLLVEEFPDWYQAISRVFWHRIYTTNADNLVERAFRASRGAPNLRILSAPRDDYEERDQFLAEIQYVKLNGSLPGDPRELTFHRRQYANRLGQHDVWYDHFGRDYCCRPTLLVGSELDEPLFWQALETRQRRGHNPEERPRSFLITPSVSPPKLAVLRELNLHHVPSTAENFFLWLAETYSFPTRRDVLVKQEPIMAEALTSETLSRASREALQGFLGAFPAVPLTRASKSHRRAFFLGVPPTWEDVACEFDAPREATKVLLKAIDVAIEAPAELTVLGLLGAGGTGKSTVLRRLARSLAHSRGNIFFSDGTTRPSVDDVRHALEELEHRAVLIVDNAHLLGPILIDLVETLSRLARPPILVFAARHNLFESRLSAFNKRADTTLVTLDTLTTAEIEDLIAVLERFAQLGHLETLSPSARVQEFTSRAGKQLLVAMREATEGRGFDEIVRDEFAELPNGEARTLYLCACLATAENIDLCREQLLACAEVSPADALAILRTNLKGMLTEQPETTRMFARHSIIADLIVTTIANREDLSSAYVRILSAIAHDIYTGRGRQNRSWRLFVRLIDHRKMFERFSENVDSARTVYLTVADHYRDDGHFWLQLANLEIEFGDLDHARPHLAQAEALMPYQEQVITTRGNLLLRGAISATHYQQALTERRAGEEVLIEQIERIGVRDEYPDHVYLSKVNEWIQRWATDTTALRDEYEALRERANSALERHPASRRLRSIHQLIERNYLSIAVRRR